MDGFAIKKCQPIISYLQNQILKATKNRNLKLFGILITGSFRSNEVLKVVEQELEATSSKNQGLEASSKMPSSENSSKMPGSETSSSRTPGSETSSSRTPGSEEQDNENSEEKRKSTGIA